LVVGLLLASPVGGSAARSAAHRAEQSEFRFEYTIDTSDAPEMKEWADTLRHEIAVRMNEAMRQGRYAPSLWEEYTGKTVDDLWAEYIKTLQGVK
jgi:hypothetical protein